MNDEQKGLGEVGAIAVGCIGGLVVGTALGGGLAMLLGGVVSVIGLIVMIHTAVAMMLMGAWTAPALMPRDE